MKLGSKETLLRMARTWRFNDETKAYVGRYLRYNGSTSYDDGVLP